MNFLRPIILLNCCPSVCEMVLDSTALVTQHSQRLLARPGIKSRPPQDVVTVLDPEHPRSRPDPRVCPVSQHEDQAEDENTVGNEDFRGPRRRGRQRPHRPEIRK